MQFDKQQRELSWTTRWSYRFNGVHLLDFQSRIDLNHLNFKWLVLSENLLDDGIIAEPSYRAKSTGAFKKRFLEIDLAQNA